MRRLNDLSLKEGRRGRRGGAAWRRVAPSHRYLSHALVPTCQTCRFRRYEIRMCNDHWATARQSEIAVCARGTQPAVRRSQTLQTDTSGA